jgi:DNA-binding transcriptional MerR regulator
VIVYDVDYEEEEAEQCRRLFYFLNQNVIIGVTNMRTVKQVSELTGISVRTLQYYDEIDLFKPSQVTEAGYRLYDDASLGMLQQILFFKELDFRLKDIKRIIDNPNFNKTKAFQQQKELIKSKRDRLDGLLNLLERLERGEKSMSFKEFSMSEYFKALEEFKENHTDEIIQMWGSIEEFDKLREQFKDKESEIAQLAIQQYGSIEKYTEAMKHNLDHFSETMEKLNSIKDSAADYMARNTDIMTRLTQDPNKDATSDEIQALTGELVELCNSSLNGIDMGDNYWDMVIDGYLTNDQIIEVNDKIYGVGSSNFLGRALKHYFYNS